MPGNMQPNLKRVLGVFLSLAGLAGVTLQIITSPRSMRAIALFFLFIVFLTLGIWFFINSYCIAGTEVRHFGGEIM